MSTVTTSSNNVFMSGISVKCVLNEFFFFFYFLLKFMLVIQDSDFSLCLYLVGSLWKAKFFKMGIRFFLFLMSKIYPEEECGQVIASKKSSLQYEIAILSPEPGLKL